MSQEQYQLEDLQDQDQEQDQEQEQDQPQPQVQDQPDEAGQILAKDGKHTIPYKELEETRKKLQELKQQNEVLKKLAAVQQLQTAPPVQQEDTLRKLLDMDKESFRAYVTEKGVDALYDLREAVKKEAQERAKQYTVVAMQKMMEEAKVRAVSGIVADWAEENKDLMQDPVSAEIVKALDRALFAKLGVKDLGELGPARARKHLDTVAEQARKMLGSLQQQPAKRQEPELPPSLSRVGGGESAKRSIIDLSGPDLELAMLNMTPDEIEKLFEE